MATETATLAGGCFWGMEELFRELPGVIETRVGYTGGTTKNATYEHVTTGAPATPSRSRSCSIREISYEQILEFFFRMHDPTTANRQGNDVGSQYRSAIFVHDDQQKEVAEEREARRRSVRAVEGPVVTEIVPAGEFWSAEAYHQDYLQKNPGGYTCHYVRPFRFSEK